DLGARPDRGRAVADDESGIMRRPLAALALVVLTLPAFAQTLPFDMSPERPASSAPPAAAPSEPPAAEAQPAPAAPAPAEPAPETAAAPPVTEPAAGAAAFVRHVVPFAELVLAGEIDRRAWAVYLTPEQAASPAKLNIGYSNS